MKEEFEQDQLFHEKHRFLLFISMAVIISIIIAVISMAIYNGSGAAQLDLSRPGYKSVRSQAVNTDGDFKPFSANGELNREVISSFIDLYNKRTQKVKSVDAFGGDPLSSEALGLALPPN